MVVIETARLMIRHLQDDVLALTAASQDVSL
jgi:hypothetical protein